MVDLGVGCIGARVLRRALDDGPDRRDGRTEPRRQNLLELGERTGARFLHPGDAGRRAEAHRHRDRLLVVEEERRQLGTRAEPVAPGGTPRRLDRVVERAQPLGADPVPLPDGEVLVASGPLADGALPGETTAWLRR